MTTLLPAAGDERPGTPHDLVDARELDAAYVIIRDADERLQMVSSAARVMERSGEYMLDLLREAQWLLGCPDVDMDAWRARRDAFMSVRLPDARR